MSSVHQTSPQQCFSVCVLGGVGSNAGSDNAQEKASAWMSSWDLVALPLSTLRAAYGLEAGSNFDLRCPTLMAAININVNHTLSSLCSALFN